MVDVDAALHLVTACRPGEAVRVLHARFGVVVDVGGALAHDDEIRELERRLLQHRGKIERAARRLHPHFAHHRRRQDRHEAGDGGLIARQVVARRARRRRRAPAAAEEVVGVGIEKVVADRQRVGGCEMVIQLQHERVIVVLLQLAGRFRRQAELGANGIERRQIVLDDAREAVGLAPHLSLVVAEEEGAVRRQRRTQGDAELVLVQHVRVGRIQDRPRVQAVVHAEVIGRPVSPVRPRFRDDVDEAAEGAAVLGEVRGIEDAEFLRRFL